MDKEFKIKFDGEAHQIDANILINSLIHTTSIIQEINRNLDSGKKIDIKIKALEKGSFLIHIDLIEQAIGHLKNLLTKENAEVAGTIISCLVGVIEVHKFLKGKDPVSKEKVDGKVKIENNFGNVIIIESFTEELYEKNAIVREALTRNFETLDNDDSVTAFEITDKKEKPLVVVPREDFHSMAVKSEDLKEGVRVQNIAANLNILKASFDKKLKWEFYYKGNKITAKINDENFHKKIDKGEAFSKGDVLEVELEIKQIFEESVNTFVNKSYKIRKIISHHKRDEQSKMDF